jgi:hypothetical protein
MSSTGPIWGSDLWRQVVANAQGMCQCTGQCGQKHARTGGRCDIAEGRRSEHLIAAPAVLPCAFHVAATLKAPQLIALCVKCFGGRNRIAQKSTAPAPAEGLF